MTNYSEYLRLNLTCLTTPKLQTVCNTPVQLMWLYGTKPKQPRLSCPYRPMSDKELAEKIYNTSPG